MSRKSEEEIKNKAGQIIEQYDISVDVKPMKDMIETNHMLAEENQDLRDKFNSLAEKVVQEKKKRLGIPEDVNVETIEDLKAWEKLHENEDVSLRFSGNGSSGRSSLNSEGKQSDGKTFDSQEAMIDFIVEKANSIDADAEKYRQINNQMLEKVTKGNAEGKERTNGSYEMKGGIKDFLNRKNERTRKKVLAEKIARGIEDAS